MVRHNSKDANHDAIKARFMELGCTIADMAACGVPGFPDALIGLIGQNMLVEFKNPDTSYGRAGFNANQSAFSRDWRGGRIWIVRSPDEATTLVQQWRRETRKRA